MSPVTVIPPRQQPAPAGSTDRTVFLTEYLPLLQATGVNVSYGTWAKANPNEKAAWDKFCNSVNAGQTPPLPVMKTSYGKHLVAAGKMAIQ